MSASTVISVTPPDADKFAEYEQRSNENVRRHGGGPIARQDSPLVLKTDEQPAIGAILKFPNKDAMLGYWNDPDYQPLKNWRHTFADAHAIIIED